MLILCKSYNNIHIKTLIKSKSLIKYYISTLLFTFLQFIYICINFFYTYNFFILHIHDYVIYFFGSRLIFLI